MNCFVCDEGGMPRAFQYLEDVRRVRELAMLMRLEHNLPDREIHENERIHRNCHRVLLNEINLENQDHPRFKVVLQRNNRCFICLDGRRRHLAPITFAARINFYIERDLFEPRKSLCCLRHYNDEGFLKSQDTALIRGFERAISMTSQEAMEWFKALRQSIIQQKAGLYESENSFSEEDFKLLTNLNKEQFRDFYTYCHNVVLYGSTRNISKKDAIAFLMKMKLGLSDSTLKVLMCFPSRQYVSLTITAVRTSLNGRFLDENIGVGSIGRENYINQYVTPFANELYNDHPETRKAIVYVDGTYIKIPKSSNLRALRQSYCLYKGCHLLKPGLIVAPDGYILDVHGPYFSDGRNNDAAMLEDHLQQANDQDLNRIRNWFQEDDIFIVDRGYRDALPFLNELGIDTEMPPLIPRGQRQLSTEDSNKARLITKTRWIIEARNGHIKSCFHFLRDILPVQHIPFLNIYLRIICSIINRYFTLIHMDGATVESAHAMKELATRDNLLQARVHNENLQRQIIPDDRWENLDELNVNNFPHLDLQYLRDLTLGIYQLKLAPSYIQDRLQREEVEHFTIQATELQPGLLKSRVHSRFTQRIKHTIWISFIPNENIERDRQPITGYYCTCKTGARTVGCCSHVASVLWFLGYARHENNVRYPPLDILFATKDAANRPLPEPLPH